MSQRSAFLCGLILLLAATTVIAAPSDRFQRNIDQPAGDDRVLIFIDPASGEHRQPTAAEAAELAKAGRTLTVARPLVPEMSTTGTASISLDAHSDHFWVARTGADGELVLTCVETASAADETLNATPMDSIMRLPRAAKPAAERE